MVLVVNFHLGLSLAFYKRSCRRSHQMCSIKKTVLKNFAIFTEKHLCWSFFNKSAGLQACNFIEKRLHHRCFPVNIAKFLRTPILKNVCKRLLLKLFCIKIFKVFPSLTVPQFLPFPSKCF